MATLIFVDKDNEEPGSCLASKDGLKLGSGVKALDRKLQVSAPRVGKVFNAPALPKASRKALGTVNRVTEKPVKAGKPLQPKQPTLTVTKITEKSTKTQGCVPAPDDAYPEIEKFFPFNPLDFESFDVPEEHQISLLPLNGVPLLILNEDRGLEQLPHLDPPTPLKTPFLPWESDLPQSPSSAFSSLDIELPPVCYDADI
ncbi:securin [Arvicanthis niloticus]|uniref:securin n=1 Tax=Arvicanthis niloticus TaxID=61156 RepID=UPI00148629E6|nr:securin [Arvicanthis niloticus]